MRLHPDALRPLARGRAVYHRQTYPQPKRHAGAPPGYFTGMAANQSNLALGARSSPSVLNDYVHEVHTRKSLGAVEDRIRGKTTMLVEVIALLMVSQQPMAPVKTGVASYYTVASSSSLTASGERFRDDDFTCAMLEGEFGEYFLVVAENGKSVVVRLNDRGPYTGGRVIDLSRAAMRKLHPKSGLLHVDIYPLGKNPAMAPLLN